MYRIFALLLFLIPLIGVSQSVLPLRADTIRMEKLGGSAELHLRNATRDTLGVLTNIGNGRTRFIRARIVGDTIFVGRDTLIIATDPTLQEVINNGNTISENDSINVDPNRSLTIHGGTGSSIILKALQSAVSHSRVVIQPGLLGLEYRNLSSGNNKSLTMSSLNGITVTDQDSQTGLGYAANYRTNGIANFGDRWIPDWGAVKDSMAAVSFNLFNALGGTGDTLVNADKEIKTLAVGVGLTRSANGTTVTHSADTGALKGYYLPIYLNGDKSIQQGGDDIEFTGGGHFQLDTLKLKQIPAPPNVTDYVSLGNSITFGTGATVADSCYRMRVSRYYGLPNVDLSLGGSGVWRAASNFYLNVDPGHTSFTSFMAGFNDVRRNGMAQKTYNKIVNALNAVFVNQFLASWIPAADASVTKTGTWSTGYTSSTVGGKSVGGGIFSNVLNDTAAWSFSGTTLAIGFMGADSVDGANFEYAKAKVYIDGVLIETVDEDQQWDGVSDGVYDNKRGTVPRYYTGLSAGSHTVKVVQAESGKYMIIDYFGTLVAPAEGKPLVYLHAPYMNAAGYAASPANASNAIIDQLNDLIDSIYNSFPAGYPVFKVNTNSCYDTLTGLDGDNIHPNNVGYRQIFECFKNTLPNFGTIVSPGTLYSGDDNNLYHSGRRIAYAGTDSVSYILNRISGTQTAGFKINGTGTVGTIVAPAANLGNTNIASSTGSLLNISPIANQSMITGSATVTGYVFTSNIDISATGGLLHVQRNSSTASAGYSALALAVTGSSGNKNSSPYVLLRNDGIGREYIVAHNIANGRFELHRGNQDQLGNPALFSIDSAGKIQVKAPSDGSGTDSVLVFRSADSSIRKVAPTLLGNFITSYTPTITSVTNVSGTTLKGARYRSDGAYVEVWVYVTIDPTSVGSTEIAVSLPVASEIGANELFGSGSCGVAAQSGIVTTDATNNRATFVFSSTDTGAQDHVLIFTYPLVQP